MSANIDRPTFSWLVKLCDIFRSVKQSTQIVKLIEQLGVCYELALASQTSPPVERISLLISTIPSSSSSGSSRPSYFLWKKPWEWGKHGLNSLIRLSYRRLPLFRKRLSEKVHPTIPKGIVGGLNSLFFKEVWKNDTRGHGRMFADAKRKQQK